MRASFELFREDSWRRREERMIDNSMAHQDMEISFFSLLRAFEHRENSGETIRKVAISKISPNAPPS